MKVAEIQNSIAHLARSNKELEEYYSLASTSTTAVDGQRPPEDEEQDADCVLAVQENEAVIRRMRERIELVKEEVCRRGQKWQDSGGLEEGQAGVRGDISTNNTSTSMNGGGLKEGETVGVNGSDRTLLGQKSDEDEPREGQAAGIDL